MQGTVRPNKTSLVSLTVAPASSLVQALLPTFLRRRVHGQRANSQVCEQKLSMPSKGKYSFDLPNERSAWVDAMLTHNSGDSKQKAGDENV
jgi:hypothetical protein